jgi:chromosome segregation ATPase
MTKSFSLDQLHRYLSDQTNRIAAVHKEAEEIQIGFNSAYVEWKAKHDAALEGLTNRILEKKDQIGSDLESLIEERLVKENQILAERMQELRQKLIPETQAEADGILGKGQELAEQLRQLNPQLNAREEALKSQRAELETQLEQLNGKIRKLSRGLGVMMHFLAITRQDRERQRVIGQLQGLHPQLKAVREEWKTTEEQTQTQQAELQNQWQERTLQLAQLQGELDYLEDESKCLALALRRAVRNVVDNLKEPIECPVKEIKRELDEMVEYNIQTDDYMAAFAPISGLISILEAIMEGLKRFDQSVAGLINEQQMHSAYLPKLDVKVSDNVLQFHQQWEGLGQKIHDDGRLAAHPAEFMTMVTPVLEGDLSEGQLQAMFEGLGEALNKATEKWRA